MLELQKTFSVFFSLNISKSADKNGWEGGGGSALLARPLNPPRNYAVRRETRCKLYPMLLKSSCFPNSWPFL